ncbi:hypothetical protein [Haloarchaeobius amylolyticus]|uniref:hypothetical protein n=1 Tax=Haloarchaeobius amylolyticus TaxID=1198296 RepID=UPI00226EA4B4|nr:hypothetical protein [Haloarchaeobius amylolyticus]
MRPVATDLDTGQGPPTTIPLRHFLLALVFLAAGMVMWVVRTVQFPGLGVDVPPAVVHAVLVGWVCLTILGAMTQFVPVWSGRRLASTRIAQLQLPLVAGGVAGIVAGFWTGTFWLVPAGGILASVGIWLFVCNLWWTLPAPGDWDVTETHFAVALGFLSVVPGVGLLLGLGFLDPGLFAPLGSRTGLVSAHATLAVFGVVLTTVFGALYQLASMFTGTQVDAWDRRLQRVETATYPPGVAVLALGRLLESGLVARVGAVLTLVGVVAFTAVLWRTMRRRTVAVTPTLARYAVVAVALAVWAALTVPSWLADPIAPAARYGGPGGGPVLLFGVVAVVVVGTLYHVVPFLVWLERYSDRLGHEPVPMVEDLFDHRVARADLWLVVAGASLVTAADLVVLPPLLGTAGIVTMLAGFALAGANLLLVVRPDSDRAGEPGAVGET